MTTETSKFYAGRLFWINGELYRVTKMGQKSPESNLIPMDVEIVEWKEITDGA